MSFKEKARALKRAITPQPISTKSIRKVLRGPADLTYTIAESIHTINAERWDDIAQQGGFFLSTRYLKAIETVMPSNISPRYGMVMATAMNGAEPEVLAVVVMQQIDIGAAQLAKGSKLNVITKISLKAQQRVLTCGNGTACRCVFSLAWCR
jgi:hypothetical protein